MLGIADTPWTTLARSPLLRSFTFERLAPCDTAVAGVRVERQHKRGDGGVEMPVQTRGCRVVTVVAGRNHHQVLGRVESQLVPVPRAEAVIAETRILDAAKSRGLETGTNHVSICGTRIYLRSP